MPDTAALQTELEEILRLMVDDPDSLTVEAAPMRRATIFEVRAADEDMGKIIGRRGRAAQAMRALLDCRGDLEGAQYGLEILDD